MASGKAAKAERRARVEALRREQRARERRRSAVIYGLSGAAALAVLAAAIIPSVLSAQERAHKRSVGYTASVDKAAKDAGCTGVRNDRQISRDHTESTVDYAALTAKAGTAVPPSSGPHNPDPLPDAIHFYKRSDKPNVQRAVHNLEHGFVVAWYDDALPSAEVTKIEGVAAAVGDRFIAVPWDRGTFPGDRHFVLTAWDRTQRCRSVSSAVVSAFVTKYADPQDGQNWASPTAPETGGVGGTLTAPSATPSARVSAKPNAKKTTPPPSPGAPPAPTPTK